MTLLASRGHLGKKESSVGRWRRSIAVAMVAGLALAATAGPAEAAPPSNDTEAGAVTIGGVPFVHEADTSEATRGGPSFCSNRASVFYRFTPMEDARIQVDLIGSDCDTTLGLYTRGIDGRVEPIACSDDRIGLAAGVRLRAVAGTTYHFMVGRSCGDDGGRLVFTVSEVVPAPLETTFDVASPGTVEPATGVATISGTLMCTKRANVYLEGTLRQLRGDLFVARGSWWFSGVCTPETPLEWSSEVETGTSVVFGSGPATATLVYLNAYAGWRDWVDLDEVVTAPISLG